MVKGLRMHRCDLACRIATSLAPSLDAQLIAVQQTMLRVARFQH